MSRKTVIVYLPLKPDMAKINNLPVKLPVLMEDMNLITDGEKIDLQVIIRGLEAQYQVDSDDYYGSYLVYHYYEAFKLEMKNSNLSEAENYLQKAKAIKEDYRYHFYTGLFLREKEEFDLAEIELKKSVKMNDGFYVGHYEIGRLLYFKEEFEEAVRFYGKSLEASRGEFYLPYLGIVDAYIAANMVDSAIQILENLDPSFPLIVEALLRKGVLYNTKEKYSLAEKAFSGALKKEERWQLYYNRAFSRSRTGNLTGALEDLKKAYKISEVPEVLYEMAIAEKNLGFVEDSLEHLKSYYETTEDSNAMGTIVRILNMLGDYDEGLALIDNKPEFKELKKNLLLFRAVYERKSVPEDQYESIVADGLRKRINNGILDSIDTEIRNVFPGYLSDIIKNEKVDYGILLDFLSKSESTGVSERALEILNGLIPGQRSMELANIELYISLMAGLGTNVGQLELLSYRFPFMVSGSGESLGICRLIYNVYMWCMSGTQFNVNWFLDEYLDEIKDFSYPTALKLAHYADERLMDVDTALETDPEEPLDFILKLFSLLNSGYLQDEDQIGRAGLFYEMLKMMEAINNGK